MYKTFSEVNKLMWLSVKVKIVLLQKKKFCSSNFTDDEIMLYRVIKSY